MTTTYTKTVGPGKDYPTITAWEAAFGGATDGDLVGNDEAVVANVFSFVETIKVIISAFTSGNASPNSIIIQADSSARHDGTYSTNCYRLEWGNTFNIILEIASDWVVMDGLMMKQTSTVGSNQSGAAVNGANITVKNMIAWYAGTDSGSATAFALGGTVDGRVIENCLTFGGWVYGYHSDASSAGGTKVINCTDHGARTNSYYSLSNKTLWTNNLSIGAVTRSFNAFPNSASNYNAADDGFEYGTNSFAITEGTPTDIFNNFAGDDFHLASSASCIDQGIGTTNSDVPGTDIDGDSRESGTCDIGCDEVVGAPPVGGLPVGTLNMMGLGI